MGKKKKAEMENIKLYFKHSPSSRAGFACLNRSDANVCGQWAARSIGVLIFGALHPLASSWHPTGPESLGQAHSKTSALCTWPA